MNRTLTVCCMLFVVAVSFVVFADTPEEKADKLFAEGRYAEGQTVLHQALEAGLTPERQASIHAALASFYGDMAGDLEMARSQWIRIRRLPLRAEHPLMVEAADQLQALRLQKERFARQSEWLSEAATSTDDPELLKQRISGLKSLIRDYPDFPDRARACHLLGQLYLKREQYWPAVRSYDRAVKLKPAIAVILPVDSARSIAYLEFKREFIPRASWTVIGVIFFAALISALRARPHLKLEKTQRKAVLLVLAGWVVLFLVLTAVLLASDLHREGIPYPKPTLLKKLWYQPGGIRLLAIFVYGLLIGTATFLVAAATVRWRSRALRSLIMLTVVAVMSLSMAAGHRMMFLSRDTEYLPEFGIYYSLIYMNKYELPDSKEAILQMLSNASEEEKNRLMEYHFEDWDPEKNRDKTIDELAEMLLEKELAEK